MVVFQSYVRLLEGILLKVKTQCHKPPILEWFTPPVDGDLGGGLLLF